MFYIFLYAWNWLRQTDWLTDRQTATFQMLSICCPPKVGFWIAIQQQQQQQQKSTDWRFKGAERRKLKFEISGLRRARAIEERMEIKGLGAPNKKTWDLRFKERLGDRGESGDLRARSAEDKNVDFRFKARPGDRRREWRFKGAERRIKQYRFKV